MLNLVPISDITYQGHSIADSHSCPICHGEFSSEKAKVEHLERKHPGWAFTIMSAYLRQTPRDNG